MFKMKHHANLRLFMYLHMYSTFYSNYGPNSCLQAVNSPTLSRTDTPTSTYTHTTLITKKNREQQLATQKKRSSNCFLFAKHFFRIYYAHTHTHAQKQEAKSN